MNPREGAEEQDGLRGPVPGEAGGPKTEGTCQSRVQKGE